MPWELLDSRKRPWKSKVACRREKPLWVSSRKKTRNLETCKNQTHRLSARTARLTLLRRDLAISGRCGFCCCCCSSSSNERRFRDLMKQGKKKRKVSKVIRVRFFLSQKKVERKKKLLRSTINSFLFPSLRLLLLLLSFEIQSNDARWDDCVRGARRVHDRRREVRWRERKRDLAFVVEFFSLSFFLATAAASRLLLPYSLFSPRVPPPLSRARFRKPGARARRAREIRPLSIEID